MIRLLHEPAPQLDSSDLRWKHRVFSLRVCPAFLSSLRYPAHSALVAELLIFDRGLMAEHAGSGAAAHEWEDASSQAAPGEGSPAATPRRMSAASDGAVHGTPQGTPGSAQSAPAAPARRMGGKGKGRTPSMPPPQMPVPPGYTQPYPAMSQLRWEQDVYGHWWYSDGQHWWYGHGGSHRFTAPPAGPIPTPTSSIGASWQFVNPETVRHPSGPKKPRDPPAPKKSSKPSNRRAHPTRRSRLPRVRSRHRLLLLVMMMKMTMMMTARAEVIRPMRKWSMRRVKKRMESSQMIQVWLRPQEELQELHRRRRPLPRRSKQQNQLQSQDRRRRQKQKLGRLAQQILRRIHNRRRPFTGQPRL